MKPFFTSFLVAACVLTGAKGAWADAAYGLELAEEYCVRCHDISPGGAAKTYPPSFASVAWFRDDDQIRARILFPSLHGSMPVWSNWLLQDEVDSLVAFVRSLEGS